MKWIVLLFGMFLTWCSYEIYHWMRDLDFGLTWVMFGVTSVAAAFLGGTFIKAGAEAISE